MHNILKPIATAVLAALFAHSSEGCIPPGGADMEAEYKAKIMECVRKSPTVQESCECRKEVDEYYGLCDHPEWPKIGRCDYRCE